MNTRTGAPGNQLLNLGKVTSALASQRNIFTNENLQFRGLVNYFTNAVTTLTTRTIENTKKIQELKRGNSFPKKKN